MLKKLKKQRTQKQLDKLPELAGGNARNRRRVKRLLLKHRVIERLVGGENPYRLCQTISVPMTTIKTWLLMHHFTKGSVDALVHLHHTTEMEEKYGKAYSAENTDE